MNPETSEILLVEDDPRDVELVREAFAANGISTKGLCVAGDGEAALAYLRRDGEWAKRADTAPVLVLLDLKLPRMSGLECLAALRAERRLRDVPVVILTSSRAERDRRESYRLGANAYVVKPVRFADFVVAVERIAGFWLELNEPPDGRSAP